MTRCDRKRGKQRGKEIENTELVDQYLAAVSKIEEGDEGDERGGDGDMEEERATRVATTAGR